MEQNVSRLAQVWLLFGKLLALTFIFAGGCLLATLVLPLLSIFPGNPSDRAQYLVHKTFRFYIKVLQTMGWIRVEVQDILRLSTAGGRIIVANHPSLLDVVLLMAFVPRAQCIVKHQLWNTWLLGGLVRRAGYIRNDLEPEALIASCRASLDAGRRLIIFPEGTRTSGSESRSLHRGFANIALLTEASIQPVHITCDPPFLFRGEAWWHVPATTPLFRIVVGEHIDANTYSLYGQRSLAARKLVEVLEHYYADRTNHRDA